MPTLDSILTSVASLNQKIFGDNLVGVYLHGSAALGCYNPDKSDVDFITVVKNPPTNDEKAAYITDLLQINSACSKKGIETSVVLLEHCRHFTHPTPYELHYSNAYLTQATASPADFSANMHGLDPDLAAHFTVINSAGVVICGRPISEVFAKVPRQYYIDSIMYDIAAAPDDITSSFTYTTLNLCRTLAYSQDGKIRSKKQGGEYCLTLPGLTPYHNIITAALDDYTTDKTSTLPDKAELHDFAVHMLEEIKHNLALSGE